MSVQPLRQLVVTIRLTGCPTRPINDILCQTLTSFCLFVCLFVFALQHRFRPAILGRNPLGLRYLPVYPTHVVFNKNSIQKSNALATWR